MLNNLNNGRNAETRHFLRALVVSLVLHLVLLSRAGMWPSAMSTTRSGTLHVTLTPPAATTQAPIVPIVLQAAAAPEGAPSPQQAEVPATHATRVSAPVSPINPVAPMPAAEASRIAPSGPVKELPQADQPTGFPRPGPAGAAKRVEIEFEIFSGADRQLMGKGRHLYASDNDSSYGVSIKQTLTADEADQGTSWRLEISGRIDRQGLNPLLFQMQGAVPERLMALKEVAASPSPLADKTRNGRMPDGILDRQSLLYQFMLVPPSDSGGKLWLSDGKTYASYTYHIAGFEAVVIASLGEVRTMKLILSSNESAETIELWLIPDKRFLPAKLRHTDRLGVVTEQVVISLDAK